MHKSLLKKIRENKCLSYNTCNFYYFFPNLFKYCDYLQKNTQNCQSREISKLARSRSIVFIISLEPQSREICIPYL